MTTKRQQDYKENKTLQLSDAAIVDSLKYVLEGSKGYHDKIVAMIAQGHETDRMVLEFKHYDLPDDLLDLFWKLGQVKRIVKCLNDAVREVFEYVHKEEYPENHDIHYDEIEAKLVVDDDKLVSKIRHVKNKRMYNNLVVFDGVVIQKSNHMSEITKYVYRCYSCGQIHDDKTRKCIICDSRKIDISMEESETRDYEILTIQEHQKDMSVSAIELDKIDVFLYDHLVGKFKPGNHVRVTGFPKMFSPNKNIDEKLGKGYNTDVKTLSNMYIVIEAHNIQHMQTPTEILLSNPTKAITEYEEKAILGLRRKYPNDSDLLSVLTNSFAPYIYGHQSIKQSILIQSVGSVHVRGQRSNINILIVGDAGLGKSKLLDAAKDINIHSSKAVGKGASGVGLTASVIKDANGMPRLSIGAAVLADKGVCIIDELSNIADEYKAHLLECMENGTFTINKHGINQTLNANAAFLVASNPDSGKYSTFNTLTENIKISPPLLSRFDLIFVVIDSVDDTEDQKLRVHLAAIYNKTQPPKEQIELEQSIEKIDPDLLKKYLIYAKLQRKDIKVSKEALRIFDSFHKDLRKPLKSSDITATPRQFEGMLRIAMAMTRLLLKTEVTEDIAYLTMKLLNHAYESTGMKLGNSTGLNQTAIYSKPLNKISPKKAFILVMENLTKNNTQLVEKEDVILELRAKAEMDLSDAYELWDRMYNGGALMVENGRYYKLDLDNLRG